MKKASAFLPKIQALTAKIQLANPSDLTTLGQFISECERLLQDKKIPLPVQEYLHGVSEVAGSIILEEISFEFGVIDIEQKLLSITEFCETGEFAKSAEKEAKKDELRDCALISEDALKEKHILPENTDPSLLSDFIAESRDHIYQSETALLELESDASQTEPIHTVFRAFHTIKGVAGFLGLTGISKLAHSMETIMDKARNNQLILGAIHIDILLEGIDSIKEILKTLERVSNGDEIPLPMNYPALRTRLAVLGKDVPESASGQGGGMLGQILVQTCGVEADEIDKALQQQSEGDKRKIGEILISNEAVSTRTVAAALAGQKDIRKTAVVEDGIRVPIHKLDQLIDNIGEAVIANSMVSADAIVRTSTSAEFNRKVNAASIIMRQVQELSMSLRMVSIKPSFQKMVRLVRDLSKKVGKDVDFITEGDNTDLDKSVVERIDDPLMHMVRNALDHGIEPNVEDRIQKGKSAKARVWLRAFYKAGSVVLELEDDGRGMDRDVLLRKAIDKGLASANKTYTDNEIYQFIFLPGFSTAAAITDVSGRGVGMDVVKKNISSLRGTVEIKSEIGKGSCFTIRLPLTLAIIQGMVVRINREKYIIPTLSIITTLKPEPKQVFTVVGKGEVLNLRGELIRLIRLESVFCEFKENDEDSILKHTGIYTKNIEDGVILVVEDNLGKRAGLLVDEILDQQQVVIKNIGETMKDNPNLAGGAIMSDGTVSLIIDIGGVFRTADTLKTSIHQVKEVV